MASQDRAERPDSQDEGLVPYGVQSLFLHSSLADFVVRRGVLDDRLGGFGSGLTRAALLLVLQDGQQAVGITETWHGASTSSQRPAFLPVVTSREPRPPSPPKTTVRR